MVRALIRSKHCFMSGRSAGFCSVHSWMRSTMSSGHSRGTCNRAAARRFVERGQTFVFDNANGVFLASNRRRATLIHAVGGRCIQLAKICATGGAAPHAGNESGAEMSTAVLHLSAYSCHTADLDGDQNPTLTPTQFPAKT